MRKEKEETRKTIRWGKTSKDWRSRYQKETYGQKRERNKCPEMRKKHMIKNRKKEKRESKGKRNNHMVRKKDHIQRVRKDKEAK